ncbi:MAG: hypothetical protein E6R03_16435 [Hyphomicrobiaceae bacterium]|nr:MAG: hypothetical protein E6R03_16435 [Hyphomicrobiaceae bacterium]
MGATDSRSEFQTIERAIYKVYDFELREQRVLEFLLQSTLARGKACVHIPKEDFFNRGAKINSKGNTNVILRRLIHSFQVIEEKPPDYYGFRLPVEHWKAPLKQRITDAVLHELLGLEYNRDDLQGALRETYIETNLPTRGPVPGPVRLIRSNQSEVAPRAGETGGMFRESAGSEGDKPQTPERFPPPEPLPVPAPGTAFLGATGSGGGNPAATAQLAGVLPVVPASGTGAGPARARAVQRSTINESPNVKRLGRPVAKQTERRLMEEIAAFFSGDFPSDPERSIKGRSVAYPQEMERSGKFWRCRCVRNFPDAVEQALAEARYQYQQKGAAAFKHKPSWLNHEIKMIAGVRSWGDVPPGPAPV